MELYLVKSAACLAILMVFYKLFLERESFHVFKRIYLLGILFLAFGIPLLTFTQYIDVTPSASTQFAGSALTPMSNDFNELATVIDWYKVFWVIYGLGVLFFGIRFIFNLSSIVLRIHRNPKQKQEHFINVLLSDLRIPHTFFKFIFLNRSEFENHAIPDSVLIHEQAHALQKHSIDIIFIELLQVIFWFNPLIYLIKKEIKLNHEFLADQAVMNHGMNIKTYQQTLLAFSSYATEPQLANAINYSSIKKRFTVMITRT